MFNYQRIRDLREDNDYTQGQIAKILGMQQSQYQRYESGSREIPFHHVISLAKFYKVSLDYIAGLTNDKIGLTKSNLSSDEAQLIKNFRSMDDLHKGRLIEHSEMLNKLYRSRRGTD
ncbi:helix-turn-helix transcriptional regulator [Ruminococcus sp. Marseille-P6503]|uniref:helix-turn-helix domain-containing protein n=1 Tax=Ruminococcus sp. Marseille-P6503 TaxID=2364796 RepID=UPI000F53154D